MRQLIAFSMTAILWANPMSLLAQQPAVPQSPKPQVAAQPQTVAGGAVQSAETGISGTVMDPAGSILPNTVVRARDLLTNEIGGSTRSAENGDFTITGLKPGNYILEIVDNDGLIIGTSAFVSAAAGTILSAVTVTATTGALAAVNATTGLVATLGATAARGVTAAAAASGVAGVVAPEGLPTASPSR